MKNINTPGKQTDGLRLVSSCVRFLENLIVRHSAIPTCHTLLHYNFSYNEKYLRNIKRDHASEILSQVYCRAELSEEEKGAYKWWLFDVSECDDDTSDAERSVWSFY